MWPGQFIGLRQYSSSSIYIGEYMFSRYVLEMPGRLVDLLGRDVRRVDDVVAARELLLLLELLDLDSG